jgi:L-fuconolactonase
MIDTTPSAPSRRHADRGATLVTDSQVHIWRPEEFDDSAWPVEQDVKSWVQTPFGAEALLGEMDAAGVARAFLVPPAFDGVGNNDYCLDTARRHPDRFRVMGRLPLDAPEGPELVERWAEEELGLGLRFSVFMPRQRQWLEEGGGLDWFWPMAARLSLPLMIYPGPDAQTLAAVGRVAGENEGLRIAIDHMAVPPYDTVDEEAFAHLDALLALAAFPNVAVKVSALPEYSSQEYPYRNLHSYLERTIEAFGAERSFWGTDLPRLSSSYLESVTMFTEELSWLSAAELDLVMGRACCTWHGWS